MICTEVAPNSRISVSPSVTKSSQPGTVTITTAAGRPTLAAFGALLQIGGPDEAEHLADVVEDLNSGGRIVHGG